MQYYKKRHRTLCHRLYTRHNYVAFVTPFLLSPWMYNETTTCGECKNVCYVSHYSFIRNIFG